MGADSTFSDEKPVKKVWTLRDLTAGVDSLAERFAQHATTERATELLAGAAKTEPPTEAVAQNPESDYEVLIAPHSPVAQAAIRSNRDHCELIAGIRRDNLAEEHARRARLGLT